MPRKPYQPRLFKKSEITNLSRQFEPAQNAVEGATAYQAAQGKRFSTAGLGDVQRSHQHGHETYVAYRQGLEAPQRPGIEKSYAAMAEHVGRQYEHLTKPRSEGGMGITHEVTSHDPYSSPAGMAEDLKRGHIKTFATESTGPHEYFSNMQNDQFRAVHDVFGHAAIGRGFSRHGEEAAYLAHRQMFPAAAHAALASETRGQNSYLNYSPEGQFPSQEGKLVALPSWVARRSRQVPTQPSRSSRRNPGEQLSLF